MVVRELVALLGVKSDPKGFQKAEGGMNKLVAVAKAAAVAFAALKIAQWVRGIVVEIATLGDRFDKLAKRTGFSASMLQQLDHAAQLSGASLGDLETALKRLQASQVEASEGVATYADEFKRLGVEVKNQDGTLKDTQQLFFEVADGMKGLENQAEKTAFATLILGRGGAKLIPLFEEGSEGIREMMKEMKELGGLMSQEMIDASAEYIDNQRRLDVVMIGLKNSIAKVILPTLNKVVGVFIKWWKVNGQLIRQRVGDTIGKIGRSVVNVGRFIGRVVSSFVKWSKDLPKAEKRLWKLTAVLTAMGLALMKGPIGILILIAALIWIIIDDYEHWKAGHKSLIGALQKGFKDFLGIDIVGEISFIFETIKNYIFWIASFYVNLALTFVAMAQFFVEVWDDPLKAIENFIDRMRFIWEDFVEQFWGYILGIVEALNWIFPGFKDDFLSWVKFVTEWFSYLQKVVSNWVKEVSKKLPAPFRKVGELIAKLIGEKPKVHFKLAKIGDIALKEAFRLEKEGVKFPKGGKVKARPGAGGQVTNINQKTDVKIDVKALPGMNEGKLAQKVSQQVNKVLESHNRKTMKALTPGKARGF